MQSSKYQKLKTHVETESEETHQPLMNTEAADPFWGIRKIQKILKILQALVFEQMNNFHEERNYIWALKVIHRTNWNDMIGSLGYQI